MKPFFLFIVTLLVFSCRNVETNEIEQQVQILEPLHGHKVKAQEGDWLYSHQEQHLSLEDYISIKRNSISANRNKVYMLKLGYFNSSADSIFELTKEYLAVLLQAEIVTMNQLPHHDFPYQNKRDNGQVDANYILNEVLKPLLPSDAHTMLAITTFDLYPGNDWNYVFGLADLNQRVGVWSMARLGIMDSMCFNFSKCAERTLHVASHEALHTLGLRHCAMYECLMNGANSLQELDRQVSWLCPDCMAKLCWNRKIPPAKHIERMKAFYQQGYYKDSISQVYYNEASRLLQ